MYNVAYEQEKLLQYYTCEYISSSLTISKKEKKKKQMKLIANMLSEALIMIKESMRTERKLYTKQNSE